MSGTPQSTRRQFLQGHAALDAVAAVLPAEAAGELPPPATDRYLLQYARRAMACTFEIFFNAGQYGGDAVAAVAALDLVDQLEAQLSVYRSDSEISRLNARAAQEPVAVEARLFELLQLAARLHRETAGAYDITAAPLSAAWGFTRRAGRIPSNEAIEQARECVGYEQIDLVADVPSVGFRRAGIEINLGSIGKGYALDRCAELIEAFGIRDFLLHGGNSSVLARGARAEGDGRPGWSVGIRDPLHPDRRLGELRLVERALSTSGSGTQFFMHQGRRYGHILDPRTGWPAEGVLSVTVLAPTAAEADALSTAFYVMGPELTGQYCAAHPAISALMLCPGKRHGSLEKHFFAFDDVDWSETPR